MTNFIDEKSYGFRELFDLTGSESLLKKYLNGINIEDPKLFTEDSFLLNKIIN